MMSLNVKVKAGALARRLLPCLGAVAAAVLLASCGGGEQVQTFSASRVIAFGDESSVITANGSKYTVNALANGSSTVPDCSANPLWIQIIAANYGLVFPQCNVNAVPDPVSRIFATPGATVDDLSGQIDQALSEGGFRSGDLVTVFVGANDIIKQFQDYLVAGEDQVGTNLTAAGTLLASQVNRLAGYGAKVLIVTVPDMGLTPYAGDRSVGSTDSNPAVLTRLSTRFNDALLASLLNDGHKIGLVQLDEYLKAADTAAISGLSNLTFVNTTQVSCTVALPNCTTNTLVADAVNSSWLWADSLHLSALGQTQFGSIALTRATNNPF